MGRSSAAAAKSLLLAWPLQNYNSPFPPIFQDSTASEKDSGTGLK